jgi:hypothetical protein
MAAGRTAWFPFTSLAHLKLRISEIFQRSKNEWDDDPHHHGNGGHPVTPLPKKRSCMDQARNAIARTAAQIRTGHWRSAVYFNRVKKGRMTNAGFARREQK